jgi:hypothetical protein
MAMILKTKTRKEGEIKMKTAIPRAVFVFVLLAWMLAAFASTALPQKRVGNCAWWFVLHAVNGREPFGNALNKDIAAVNAELGKKRVTVEIVSKWSGPQIAEARRLAALYTGHQPER